MKKDPSYVVSDVPLIEKTLFEKVVQSNRIALPSVILTFGLGHPFDLLKTQMQANPNIYSACVLAKNTYNATGIRGFYTAGLPSFSKEVYKTLYRTPQRAYLNRELNQQVPNIANKEEIVKIITGISLAITDTILVCPIERFKVWMMTAHAKERNITSFFKEMNESPKIVHELFRGITPSLVKGCVSWTSYLIAEGKIWNAVKKLSPNVEAPNDLPLPEKLLVGSLSGIVNAICALPFDTIKTDMQKKQPINQKNMLTVIEELYKTHGMRGFYPGWQMKLMNYMMAGVIASHFNREVDKIWTSENIRPLT